jgi:hypothetical protein
MCATIVRWAMQRHPRFGPPILRIAKTSIRTGISPRLQEPWKPMVYAGFNRLYDSGRIREAAC